MTSPAEPTQTTDAEPQQPAPEPTPQSTADQTISRRDVTLICVGLGMLFAGKIADSAINGVAVSDENALGVAVGKLKAIPEVIGRWHSTDNTLTEREVEVAGIDGYVRREYRNSTTGYTVNLTLLCGHSGPMSVHPPTACFEGVGYTLASGPTVTSVKPAGSGFAYEFNKSSFRQGDAAVPEIVRVFWAWSPDGEWLAPENPRFAFRGRPYLYKIYVTDKGLEDPGNTALPQIEAFLKDALPVISDALATSESSE